MEHSGGEHEQRGDHAGTSRVHEHHDGQRDGKPDEHGFDVKGAVESATGGTADGQPEHEDRWQGPRGPSGADRQATQQADDQHREQMIERLHRVQHAAPPAARRCLDVCVHGPILGGEIVEELSQCDTTLRGKYVTFAHFLSPSAVH